MHLTLTQFFTTTAVRLSYQDLVELLDKDVHHSHKAHCLGKVVLVGKVLDDQRTDSFAQERCKFLVLYVGRKKILEIVSE